MFNVIVYNINNKIPFSKKKCDDKY